MLWILDTDHISLFQRGNPTIISKIQSISYQEIAMNVPCFVINILLAVFDISIPPELAGFAGVLIGVILTAIFQSYLNITQLRRQTTFELHRNFDSPDLLQSRISADRLLTDNSQSPQPKSYSELYKTLSNDEWKHISCTRHFFDQLGLLKKINYLDDRIANLVFSDYVNYWSDKYFKKLESLEENYASINQSEAMKWRVSSDELKKIFPIDKNA
jgi:hypothetical protein